MARTTPANVRALLPGASSDDAVIQPYIDIASAMVDNYATRCTRASEATLTAIETLLTCHLMTTMGPNKSSALKSKTIGSSSETYMINGGTGLDASPFGQQALLLDPCGVLVDMTKPSAMTWLL